MYINSIEKVVNDFDLYLTRYNGKYVGCCPVHDNADNVQAFNIDVHTGIWFCNTKHCHEKYGGGFRGFVRGLLSGGDEPCEWELVNNYLDNNDYVLPRKSYSEFLVDLYEEDEKVSIELDLPLSYLDNYNIGNCAYFLNRGFTFETLKKHCVFTCPDPSKKLFNLCIVPIFDINKTKIVGITARQPWGKCIVCDGFHNPQELCQDINVVRFASKWKHEPVGFLKGNHLYNIWNSWKYIKNYRDLIIVESPGNVWKLDQCGFHNSVGTLGSTISPIQTNLINKLNPERIFAIGDNDDAGYHLMESISETFKNVNTIELNNYNDIAEMQDEELKEFIWDKISK